MGSRIYLAAPHPHFFLCLLTVGRFSYPRYLLSFNHCGATQRSCPWPHQAKGITLSGSSLSFANSKIIALIPIGYHVNYGNVELKQYAYALVIPSDGEFVKFMTQVSFSILPLVSVRN